jgi:hypothetical protein
MKHGLLGLYLGLLLFALASASCSGAPVIYTHGIPHLLQIPGHPNAYRSGAVPATVEAITYLGDELGIHRIYEFERADEEADHAQLLLIAGAHGIEVVSLAMPPYTKLGTLDDYEDTIEGPSDEQQAAIVAAAAYVRDNPGIKVLGHCHNGNDRTGDWAGTVVLDQMTIKQAYEYMTSTGFHPELVGLLAQWWTFAKAFKSGSLGTQEVGK